MSDSHWITLNDGHRMPRLGFGAALTPDTANLVDQAGRMGYQLIDTAEVYGNEAAAGEGVRACPYPLFVISKVWNDRHGYDATLAAFDASMKRLGLETLNLFLMHWPVPTRGLTSETWKAMIRLRDEGRVASIGVCNFLADHFARIIDDSGVVPAVHQTELHPRWQQADVRALTDGLGIVTQSHTPLGRGGALDDPVIAAIGAKHGKTPAQVVIRWHIDSDRATIPKTSSTGRLAENFDIFDFALDAEDLAAMAGMDRPDGRICPDPATYVDLPPGKIPGR